MPLADHHQLTPSLFCGELVSLRNNPNATKWPVIHPAAPSISLLHISICHERLPSLSSIDYAIRRCAIPLTDLTGQHCCHVTADPWSSAQGWQRAEDEDGPKHDDDLRQCFRRRRRRQHAFGRSHTVDLW